MIKYFLQREVTAKEAIPVITFMLASNHETVLLEITEMFDLRQVPAKASI